MRTLSSLLAILLLTTPAAATCIPESNNCETTGCRTPTPVLGWDPIADEADGPDGIARYRLWVSVNSGPLTMIGVVECWWYDADPDDLATVPVWTCPHAAATQRLVYEPLSWTEFCVDAEDASGNISPDCSNIVGFCQPEIWQGCPQPYDVGVAPAPRQVPCP